MHFLNMTAHNVNDFYSFYSLTYAAYQRYMDSIPTFIDYTFVTSFAPFFAARFVQLFLTYFKFQQEQFLSKLFPLENDNRADNAQLWTT